MCRRSTTRQQTGAQLASTPATTDETAGHCATRHKVGALRDPVDKQLRRRSRRRDKSRLIFAAERKAGSAFEADDLDQRIILVARPRHFGGAQWYFVCPVMNRRASVLLMPPGAERFCSRQTWGRRVVAYRSQFQGPEDRAHAGQARVKSRLIGDCDPDGWDLPPKPKWMRWRTYNRYVERYDRFEEIQ